MKASLRFEVLKRDRFTCCYCGRTPPDVLLEVDHIQPKCDGGTDEISNLVSACTDCNRGKGARLLEEGVAPLASKAANDTMRARIKQAKQYHELLAELEELVGVQLRTVYALWTKLYEGERRDGYYHCDTHFPVERTLRYMLRHLPLDVILEAVEITASRVWENGAGPARYFYKVCHNKIRERGGP